MLLASLSLAVMVSWAQAAVPSATQPENDISALARGWTALAAGRTAEAERIADRILARDPSNHHGAALKIQSQALSQSAQALDTYERWLGRRNAEDLGLLAIVAEGVLRDLAAHGDASIRAEAARQLSPPSAPTALTAAELERLQRAAADPAVNDKSAVADALARGGTPAVPILVDLVTSGRGPNRAAAARALGTIGDSRAEPALRDAFNDEDPYVRASAAVALARVGNSTGQNYLQTMLASDVAGIRLMAAEAWNGRPGPWVDAVRPLLDDEQAITRIRAAALLAPIDPAAANLTLAATLGDPNPAVRGKAATTLTRLAAEHPEAADPAALRRQLRDADAWIRLFAAAAIRAAATAHP